MTTIRFELERHHLKWKVTTLCRYSNFKGIFVLQNDLISKKCLYKSYRTLSSFPMKLESPNLEVCKGNYGQNIKIVQSWKVTSLGLSSTMPTRHSQPLSQVSTLCRLGTGSNVLPLTFLWLSFTPMHSKATLITKLA